MHVWLPVILVAIAIVIKSCYVNFFRCRSYNGITIGVLIYSVRGHVILTVYVMWDVYSMTDCCPGALCIAAEKGE